MLLDSKGRRAFPGAHQQSDYLCPECSAQLIAKCGDLVIHHWAHKSTSRNCTSREWSESDWHLTWKEAVHEWDGWQIEKRVTTPDGYFVADALRENTVLEFVHSLSPYYVKKHLALRNSGRRVFWIYDGHVLCGASGPVYRLGFPKFKIWYGCLSNAACVIDDQLADSSRYVHRGNELWYRWARGDIYYPGGWLDYGKTLIARFNAIKPSHV